MILDHDELKRELDEQRSQTDERFQVVFTVLDKLVNEGEEEIRWIRSVYLTTFRFAKSCEK
jgi:hypothetical protein